ncbi:hypothetical protein TCAL_09913 [Tigriopus californicus]|uniref:SET domain-containing protein n=1 Tax=Tigriopus californicus TaxID=6832 RepID=A0A553P6S2_TIGCA|nr:hypothetical protein TCAL_09913 [Tigriopus californicus]
MDPEQLCFLCQNPSVLECSKCRAIFYCSDQHLQVHFGSENQCLAFKITKKPVIGNIMVATRHIRATEVILEERPAIYGPKNSSLPNCLECMGPTKERCPKCGFPCCQDSLFVSSSWRAKVFHTLHSKMIEESQCFLCQKPASNKCRSCNGSKLFFCGESHFNIHRSHGVCRKFFITWKEGVGNHMVASEEIKAGEIILIEDAAMNGPNRPRKQPFPSCLECLKPVKSGFRCPKCHFPTCDVQCPTTSKVFNRPSFCQHSKSTMHPQNLIFLVVISLGVCWVDGIFLTTTAANSALTLTIPTLTATTGTAAAVLGGLGALGAGLAVGAILAKSLNRPQEDENEGYYPVSSGYSSHSSSSYSTPHQSSSYKAPTSGYGHKKRRQGRSVEEEIKAAQEELVTINLEPVFRSLEENDVNDCAKMKVCLMGTKDQAGLSPQEVVGLICSEGPNHAIECPVFANLEELPDFTGPCEEFSAIIPLRILALRESRPETWERVNLLMDHVEDWNEVDKALWTKMAEDLIQKRCKQSKYTAEELYRAAGIFLTNGVNQGTNQGHGLYPTFSFISHGCICNSRFQIHRDRKLVLRAQIDIPRGEEITTRYLPSMIGNIRRRFKIKNNWNFDCVCLRCQDPTELGSFIGITVCPKCSQAKSPITQGANETGTTNIEHEREDGNKKASAPPSLALLFAALIEKKKKEESDLKSRNGNLESDRPGYLLPSDPLEYFSNHVCDKCGYKVNGLTIFGLTKALEDEAEEFKTIDPVQVEEKLKAWLKVLHPNHYLILKLKKRMLDVLSLLPDPEDEAEFRKKLERQIALGTALLKVVEILEPGFSLSKGRILRQLHVPRITLAKIKFKNTEIDKGEFLKMTAEAIRNMKTAVKCLEDFGDEKMDANN